MGIFSKLFVAVMAHITMENADKKNKVTSYLFSIKNRGYTFVIFFIGQYLCPFRSKSTGYIAEFNINIPFLKTPQHSTTELLLCVHNS